MTIVRAAALAALSLLALGGCDKVELKDIELRPSDLVTFVRVEAESEKTWTCYVPPIGLCVFGTAPPDPGMVANKPSKDGFTVGHNFTVGEQYSSSCGCPISYSYEALHRGAVRFDTASLPKAIVSARLLFQAGGTSQKSDGKTASNDETGTISQIVEGGDGWFKGKVGLVEVVSQFPATGPSVVSAFPAFPKAEGGPVTKKGPTYAVNVSDLVRAWIQNPGANRGVMVLPPMGDLLPGKPGSTSVAMGSFFNVRLIVTVNSKLVQQSNFPKPSS